MYSKMLLSIIATFGLWAAASVLALDPVHLITSSVQYLLLSPSYLIILNVYVTFNLLRCFCILTTPHAYLSVRRYSFSQMNDVSWGTKQQDTEDNDLGVVSAQRNKDVVEVELQNEPVDVDEVYLESLYNIRTRKPVQRVGELDLVAERMQEAKDYYANVRTNVSGTWEVLL